MTTLTLLAMTLLTPLTLFIAFWLLCGLISMIWLLGWARGRNYAHKWMWSVDIAVCLLAGPIGILLAARRALIERRRQQTLTRVWDLMGGNGR